MLGHYNIRVIMDDAMVKKTAPLPDTTAAKYVF